MIRAKLLSVPALLVCAAGCGAAETSVAVPDAPAANAAAPIAVAESTTDAATPAPDDLRLALDGEGLRLVAADSGRTRPIPFGMTEQDVLAALAFRGPPGRGVVQDCGGTAMGYAAWPDGLRLLFGDNGFAGWSVDERSDGALTTMAGVGTGSSRHELESAYNATIAQSTIGMELSAGGLGGLIDGAGADARVSTLWAGQTCIAR